MPSVRKLTMIDTTGVKDPGVRALILLARSLGWNVLLRFGEPCTIIAKDGTRVRMPTDTTIRASVWQGYLGSIMTHSTEHTPTIELMDSVIACTKKLSDDHERRLRLALGETPQQHRERMAAAKEGIKEIPQEGGLTQRIELPPLPEPEPIPTAVEATTQQVSSRTEVPPKLLVRSGPYLVNNSETAKKRGHRIYESPTITQREWNDGSIDYKCALCPFTSDTINRFSGHNRTHGGRGQVALRNKEYKEKATMTYVPVPKSESAPLQKADILEQIIDLVAPDLVAENDRLKAENDELKARIKDIENKWNALRGLLKD